MSENSPYRAPSSRLVDPPDVERLLELDPRMLRRAAFACIAFVAIEVLSVVVQGTQDEPTSISSMPLLAVLAVAYTVLFLHVINVFRVWLNVRFEYRGANGAIGALMVVNVIIVLIELIWPSGGWGSDNIAMVLGIMAASGIVQLIFGLRLLQLGQPYPFVRAMGLTALLSGVCMISVLLIILAIVLSIASEILLVRVLLYAADEAERARVVHAATAQAIDDIAEQTLPRRDADAGASDDEPGDSAGD